MIKSDLMESVAAFHKSSEQLEYVVNKALGDHRFSLNIDDSRKLRDLIDDAEKLADRGWRGVLEVTKIKTR